MDHCQDLCCVGAKETVTLRVKNRLDQDTSIHWHGIILPANMDDVPGLSFHGIAPDGMYEYKFRFIRMVRTGTTATRGRTGRGLRARRYRLERA